MTKINYLLLNADRPVSVRYAAAAMVIIMCLSAPSWSQETNELKLPEDIAGRTQSSAQDDENIKFQIEERRISGRLERVTVTRKNGLDEVYENREIDSMWLTEENQLGDVPNVRRWTLGSW